MKFIKINSEYKVGAPRGCMLGTRTSKEGNPLAREIPATPSETRNSVQISEILSSERRPSPDRKHQLIVSRPENSRRLILGPFYIHTWSRN